MATLSSELAVRPALPSDFLQVLQILNYWITTSTLITREAPLSLVDLSELYRKVRALDLPFMVAGPAQQRDVIYGFYFTWPEMTRMIRVPDMVSVGIYSHPGVVGRNLFQVMQVHFMRTLHKVPWFRGAIAESSILNGTMNRRLSQFPKVGENVPFVMKGIAIKDGKWIDQRWLFISKAAGVQLQNNYEDMLRAKL